ncbi:MAG: GlsB/YeaQ/YmgE family stress response membrane protein [Nocardioides sp.]
MGSVIGYLIAGLIVGLLGKFVAPGNRDNIPLWLTVICGIAGVLIGYQLFGVGNDNSFDFIAFVVSVILAAVFVMVAATVTARKKV